LAAPIMPGFDSISLDETRRRGVRQDFSPAMYLKDLIDRQGKG
jgi:hypothetical protein